MGKVSLGIVSSPIGLKGHFRCRLYSHPPSWKIAYITLAGSQKAVTLESWPYSSNKNICSCTCEGFNDRFSLAHIMGLEVWLHREELPKLPDDEIYFCDIIGYEVVHNNQKIGILQDVYDFGAGTVLKLDSGEFVHWVSVHNIENNRIYLCDSTDLSK